ncbi:APC family permease [Nonomuraea sp. NPDC026600]|uniref:APC family permease n=1 Tax=Nonomuraea sp. NPDC026600 TaxID=3155363 RepID=UPI0033D04E5D
MANTEQITTGPPTVRRTLSTWKIIVLIIATMTPLSATAGTLPLGLAFGGPSTALMFIVAGVIVGIFCIGYAQMVRRINRPGAFYNYITRGLGRPAGVGAAMIAVVGYPVGLVATAAVQAIVAHEVLSSTLNVNIDWQWLLLISTVITALFAWRQIDFNAKVVSVVVVVEVVAILVLAIAIIVKHGSSAIPLDVFSWSTLEIGDWKVALVFAILCFQGYEAGALYSPEAKDPERTVPRALYGALIILTGVLAFESWTLTGLAGRHELMDTVQQQGFVGFIFGTVQESLGTAGLNIFAICVLVAQLACAIGITSFMGRYLNGLAKDRVLPSFLAKDNKHGAPGTAVLLLSGLGLVVPLILSAVGIDPYTQLAAVGFGLGALAATALQGLASASVIAFFLREGAGNLNIWKRLIAPALATVLLITAFVTEIQSFTYITGNQETWTKAIPWILPLVFVIGLGVAFYFKANRPDVYDGLASGDSAEEAAALRAGRVEV